ncbi:MAG: glycosyltransferase family 4 protein [bacterium]|nr:glycosyltransferase family 4 protein [bacterium]
MNHKKKILVFSTAYMPLVGGAELAIKEITDRIPEYDFFMITTRFSRAHPKQEHIGNIEVYRVGTGFVPLFDKLLSPILGAVQARALMKKHSFSLFWSMMVSFTSLAPFFLKIIGMHKKTPILLTLQEGDSEAHLTYRYAGLMYVMWKLAVRHANGIQAISNYLANLARARGARASIDIVPNGVAISHFTEERAVGERDALKEKLGKKPGDIYIITTSRLVLKNAVDDGIKALQYLPSHIQFLILGRGPLEQELKDLAKKLRLESRVIFAGEVHHKEMPTYLQISDAYLRPSLSEGLGSSFLEAMAAGIPVIATRVGGIPDFLTDRVTGLFCKVRNPQSIAEKVTELLGHDELRNSIVRNAKRMVDEKYDWNAIATEMKIVFDKCIHNS